MKSITLPITAIVNYAVNRSGESKFGISRKMNRNPTFINDYTTKGRIPSTRLLFEIIAACGYEVHIIGHGEDITVEVSDE